MVSIRFLALGGFEDKGSVPWLSMNLVNVSPDINGARPDMIRLTETDLARFMLFVLSLSLSWFFQDKGFSMYPWLS